VSDNYAVSTLQTAFKEAKKKLLYAHNELRNAKENMRRWEDSVKLDEKIVADIGMALEALGAPRE